MDIILLTVDCLRADHCSWYGYERNTTPTIDRLADDAASFETAYSASSHTREALPAIITGQDPNVFSDNDYRMVGESVAAALGRAGYRTGAFHSNANVSRVYGYGGDFEEFDDDLYVGTNRLLAQVQRLIKKYIHQRPLYYARADTINRRCLEWEATLEDDDPMFLWAHYMDVHGPYDPVAEYRDCYCTDPPDSEDATNLFRRAMDDPKSITSDERQILVDLYDAEIRYVDAQIDALLTELNSRGRLDDTLVIITSDHGDGFGEHGYYNHPRCLHDELINVPLVVNGLSASGTVDVPVSTLDIVPTIREAVGQANDHLPGTSLERVTTEADRNRVVFSQVRGEGEESDIRRFRANTADCSAMLEQNLETGEITHLRGAGPESELMARLEAYSSERWTTSDSEESESTDVRPSEVDERLEALGYK